MSPGLVLTIGLGGSAGAVLRVWLDGRLAPPHPFRIPRGTLLVNVLGSLVLGAAIVATGSTALDESARAVVAAGLCGALSTYSSFAVASASLWLDGRRGASLLNVALNVLLGWMGAVAGMAGSAWALASLGVG